MPDEHGERAWPREAHPVRLAALPVAMSKPFIAPDILAWGVLAGCAAPKPDELRKEF